MTDLKNRVFKSLMAGEILAKREFE